MLNTGDVLQEGRQTRFLPWGSLQYNVLEMEGNVWVYLRGRISRYFRDILSSAERLNATNSKRNHSGQAIFPRPETFILLIAAKKKKVFINTLEKAGIRGMGFSPDIWILKLLVWAVPSKAIVDSLQKHDKEGSRGLWAEDEWRSKSHDL